MAARFLVSGCARSGTGYTATLLSAAGCPCGHEEVFNPNSISAGDELVWPDELPGESSWLAAPFVRNLPTEVALLHQVREPVAFLRSKVRTRFFEQESTYRVFAEHVCPELTSGTALERAMKYWIVWNRFLLEHGPAGGRTYVRYRLEDLDAELLHDLLERVGHDVAPEPLANLLASHPRDYNSRGRKERDSALRLDTLPQGELLDELLELALELGYAPVEGSPKLRRVASD